MAVTPLANVRLPRGLFAAKAAFVVAIGLLLMGYFILEHFREPVVASAPSVTSVNLEQVKKILQTGNDQERRHALMQLVTAGAEEPLAECLASPDTAVAQFAAAGLWECWLNEAGNDARELMDAGILAMNDGELDEASAIFRKLMAHYPHWAEAVNKQATVLYLQGKPEESIPLCRQVVALKPHHFGAWNGLALCAIQTEDWPLALAAVQESLRLQPDSPSNLQLLKLVQSRITQA